MSVTPEEAIEMIDTSLSALSMALENVSEARKKDLWLRADRLLDNRLKMMRERDLKETP